MSLLGNSTAIKQPLQQQILAVMDLSAMGIAAADFSNGAKLTPSMIPTHRLSDDSRVVYRSAIALKLAPLAQRPALDIANQLMASFPITSQDTNDSMCLDFSVEVVFPGWINFRLSEQSLARWLQHLIQTAPFVQKGRKDNQESLETLDTKHQGQLDKDQKCTQNLFPAQYAHARCCSLLRLAHRQGLIKLRDLDFKTVRWQLIEPNPIPWLNDDQETDPHGRIPTTKNEYSSPLPPTTDHRPPIFKTDTGLERLRLVHPAELRLIAQIVDWLDEISDQEQHNWVKLVSALSSAFDNFYSSCRIWGEVKTQNPKLAQARLGLVAVTQASLRALLEDQLGVSASIEL